MTNDITVYDGFNENVITLFDGGCEVGAPVKVDEDENAAPCDEDDAFLGVCVGLRAGLAAVQTNGCVRCAYSGDITAPGAYELTSDGSGGVAPGSGRLCYVLRVDETNGEIEFLM